MARKYQLNFERLLGVKNRCVLCGKVIPFGRSICLKCAIKLRNKGLK